MSTDLAEGDKAPAFKLPRDGGGSLALADFKGRKLVLYFYPKTSTPRPTLLAAPGKPLIFQDSAVNSRRPARTVWGCRRMRSRPRTSSRPSTT